MTGVTEQAGRIVDPTPDDDGPGGCLSIIAVTAATVLLYALVGLAVWLIYST